MLEALQLHAVGRLMQLGEDGGTHTQVFPAIFGQDFNGLTM